MNSIFEPATEVILQHLAAQSIKELLKHFNNEAIRPGLISAMRQEIERFLFNYQYTHDFQLKGNITDHVSVYLSFDHSTCVVDLLPLTVEGKAFLDEHRVMLAEGPQSKE